MASPAMNPQLQEILEKAKKNKEKQNTSATPTATTPVAKQRVEAKDFDVEGNTFAKIVFSDATPEAKKEAIAKAMVFDTTQSKEENQKRLKEFDLFKEFLQSERQRMAQDIIDLTDTDAFAQMHEMFVEMNGAIIEFDESLKPLTDILDAVYNLRMQGQEFTLDVVKEIKSDALAKEQREKELTDRQVALKQLGDAISQNELEIGELSKKKKFFGLGGIQEEAQVLINQKTTLMEQAKTEKAAQEQELTDLRNKPLAETKFAEFQQEKEQLSILLNISSPEHVERQKRLVDAAQNFVNTTSRRSNDVLDHFSDLGEHIETLGDANRGIASIYAIVADASIEAAAQNKEVRDRLQIAPEKETKVATMSRLNKKADVEDFIAVADSTAGDTNLTHAELTEQSSRILTMKDANREQVAATRRLASSGVASVAEGLSSALTALNGTALQESGAMAQNSVDIMKGRTDLVNQKEALRQANGIADQAAALERAAQSLAGYSDTSKMATEIAVQNYGKVKDAAVGLRELIDTTKDSVEKLRAVPADLEMQSGNGAKGTFDKAAGKKAANDTGTTAKKPAGPKTLKESPVTKLGQG